MQTDEELLEAGIELEHARHAVQLRLCEKTLLQATEKYAHERKVVAEREHAAKDEPKPLDMDDLELDEELDVMFSQLTITMDYNIYRLIVSSPQGQVLWHIIVGWTFLLRFKVNPSAD